MTEFKLRLLRPARIDGRVVAAGVVVVVDAAQAGELIRAEAAVLCADADLPRLVAALGLRNGMRRPLVQ